MRSGKKFTTFVALILCAATLLMPVHITAADESESPFTVDFAAEEKIYHPGDTIEVIGTLTGIADGYGLIMLQVDSDDVEYDKSVMTLTDSAAIDCPPLNWDGEPTANGEVWLEDITQKNPITSTEGVLSDALSFKLIFSIKEDAKLGDASISVIGEITDTEFEPHEISGVVNITIGSSVCTHVNTTVTRENEIPATHLTTGSYTEVLSCDDCLTELSRTPKTIPYLSKIVAEDGSLYYYSNGARTYAGLIKIDGDYYYVRTPGEVVHGKKYWITKTNGLMGERSYEFDADGKLVNPIERDDSKIGIVEEEGTLYYYENGVRTYAGLIKIGNDYYYVRTSGEVVHGCAYWISKTNGLMGERSYEFDADGKMINPIERDDTKNGIVEEEGTLYYYENGVRTYAGLIKIGNVYYYVKTSGEVVHGQTYWISQTNGYLPERAYTFAEDGKLIG